MSSGQVSTNNKNEVVVGLERDHKLYQTKGFSYGYNLGGVNYEGQYLTPLLFARKKKRNAFIKLSDLSFRQFYRLSERVTSDSNIPLRVNI